MLDHGPSIEDNFQFLWQDSPQHNERSDVIPPVDYNSHSKISDKRFNDLKQGGMTPNSGPQQYHPVLDIAGISPADIEVLNQDPFYVLSRLYLSTSQSWSQVLNVMEEDIATCREARTEDSAEALEQLQFNAGLLERFRGYLAEDLDIIECRGSSSWHPSWRCSKLDEIQVSLLKDYRYLISRAEQLTKRCEMSSSILVSTIGVLESQKSIAQAQQVNTLTRLAFVYIPMSFIAAVFGMNVKEIDTLPSIWVFFAVAVPFTLVSLGLASWSSAKHNHGTPEPKPPIHSSHFP